MLFLTRFIVRSPLPAATLLLLLILPPAVFAATIRVGTGCTISQAFDSAKNNAAPSGSSCVAGDGSGYDNPDTIVLTGDVTVSSQITPSTNPVSQHAIILRGNGYRISGGGSNSIFLSGASTHLTLDNVIISGGRSTSGAGAMQRIRSPRFIIRDSVFDDNRSTGGDIFAAGAIDGAGSSSITIEDSVFRNNTSGGNAGAIRSNGRLTIRRSLFANNSASSRGGAILSEVGLTVEDSSFAGNSATGDGGAIWVGGDLTLRNTTFTGNTGARSIVGIQTETLSTLTYEHITATGNTVNSAAGSGVIARYHYQTSSASEAHNLNLRNSVLAGNTGADAFCYFDFNKANALEFHVNIENSYIEDGSCEVALNLENNGPTFLSEQRTAASGQVYFEPQPRGFVTEVDEETGVESQVVAPSPLVGAGNAEYCPDRDQLGRARSQTACDIGAIEYTLPATPEPETRAATRRASPRSTCETRLPGSVRISPIYDGMQCQQVGDAGLGDPSIVAAGYLMAVDVWGWVGGPGAEVCFNQPGSVIFVDTSVLPRTRATLPSYQRDGQTCARIHGVGMVVLLSPNKQETRSLRACWATALAVLNLRSTPAFGDNVIGYVKEGAVIQTDQRAGDWYRVQAEGLTGWISADYTRTAGVCMPAGG